MRAVLGAALVALCALVAVPNASARTRCHRPKLLNAYSANYHAVKQEHGTRAPGRNIRKRGVRFRYHGGTHMVRSSTCKELAKSLRQLRAIRRPAPRPGPPTLVRTVSGPAQAPGGVQTAGVAARLPACADESHGNYSTGPANTNPSSGATGRWQTLRSHYQRGGVCQGLDVNSPGGQDTCAARIYDQQGAGAWVGC